MLTRVKFFFFLNLKQIPQSQNKSSDLQKMVQNRSSDLQKMVLTESLAGILFSCIFLSDLCES